MKAEDIASISSGAIAVAGLLMPAVPIQKRWIKGLVSVVFLVTGSVGFYANRVAQQKSAREIDELRKLLLAEKQERADERKKDQAERREERESADRTHLASMIAAADANKKPLLLKIAKEKGWSTERVHAKEAVSASVLTGWGIPQDAFEKLTDALAPFATPGERTDLISIVRGEALAENLASYLARAFRNATWNVPAEGFRHVDEKLSGVVIVARSRKANPPGAEALVSFLMKYKIEPALREDKRIPEGTFQIIVGTRPPELAPK